VKNTVVNAEKPTTREILRASTISIDSNRISLEESTPFKERSFAEKIKLR